MTKKNIKLLGSQKITELNVKHKKLSDFSHLQFSAVL